MKRSVLLLAALLACLTGRVGAAEFFFGADVAPYVAWKKCSFAFLCGNSGYDGNSSGGGLRAGVWLSESGGNVGVEAGYDSLGRISGRKVYSTGGFATWKNSATITYLALAGESRPRELKGALSAKLGLYRATVDTDGDYGLGAGPYTRKVANNGVMLGAAYTHPFTPHLAARAAADMYLSVRVADPTNSINTFSETLVKLALGVEYRF